MSWTSVETIREQTPRDSGEPSDALHLLVIAESALASHELPKKERLTIGRSEECDIFIDDPLVSREHAVLHLGARLEIEDLGSANGTRVLDAQLTSHERVPLSLGQVVEVGTTMLILQTKNPGTRPRKLWTHSYFESRLEEECARAKHGQKTSFAVIRVHVATGDKVQDTLTSVLRANDVVASYAPGEYELLLLATTKKRAEELAKEITSKLDARAGVATYPLDATTPEGLLSRACAELRPERDHSATHIIIEDESMKHMYRALDRIARGTISVLLLGETGVGKEVVAGELHRRSPRSARPFVGLNCASLSETLVESELFGHDKGAFTGAEHAKIGLLEAANGGTVFLDEVGELPLGTQAKLLRVIEQKQVLPVGSVQPRPIDVRIVSATNRELLQEISEKRFRQDLYFRLNGISILVPPLRDRPKEIGPLAELFLQRASRDLGIDPPSISPRARELLENYAWPGNVRELRNVMERVVLLATDDVIEPEHLPLDKLTTTWTVAKPQGGDDKRARIIAALDACAGNQTRAAEMLGVSRRTLTQWLEDHDIPRPRKKV